MGTRGWPCSLLFGLVLLLAVGSAPAQDFLEQPASTEQAEWAPPELADLPPGWWLQFQNDPGAPAAERFESLYESLLDAVGRLDGENLVAGQDLLQSIRTQFGLLQVVRSDTGEARFEEVPVREAYTLDEFFKLRHDKAELEDRLRIPNLRIGELQQQADIVQDRRDSLLLQYQQTDRNTPERLLLGLRRIEARLESELIDEEKSVLEDRVDRIREQQERVEQRLAFARDHLVSEPGAVARAEKALEEAAKRHRELTDTLASVQRQLLTALSAPQSKPSLIVLRKQQLTRVSVAQALARLEEITVGGKRVWHLQRSEEVEAADLDGMRLQRFASFIDETLAQTETWTAASRATLLTPVAQNNLNAVKNIELAQSVAQETLSMLSEVQHAIADVQALADLITTERLGMEQGLQSIWARGQLLFEEAWDALSNYLEITLFHVGDVPVTFGSILTMLVILLIGWAISWIIRHSVERLKSRRQFASTAAVYTLSRLLHYIIIFIAVLAAFGSIGLDFSNFALIAGALSVGIGFGLQSVVNNFVSGLILLFEGSLRVGDYIELDTGLRGVVKEINTRATVINTNDSVDVVVPNSKFVTNELTNWTLREPLARFRIEFGVAYGSDKETVRAAALEAANRVDFIVHHTPSREPEVWLVGYGDSALVFQLLAWVSKAGVRRPERVRSTVLWELETQLREHGIEIPFPQRDLHLRSGFLRDPESLPGQPSDEPIPNG